MQYGIAGACAFAAALAAASGFARAAGLKIGLAAESGTLDPRHHNLIPNNSMFTHVFGSPPEAKGTRRPWVT